MVEQEMTEEQAREEARKLARKIGDEEWKKGNTKYALEAWEASDITAAELLSKAEVLLGAEKIASEHLGDWTEKYHEEILSILGWQKFSPGFERRVPSMYRAAAIACLKMIK